MSAHPIILDDITEHRQQDVVFLAYSVSLPLVSRLFPRALLTKSCFGWESVWWYLVVPCRKGQKLINYQLRRRLLRKFVFAGQGAYSILNLIGDATFPSWIRIMDSWVCCQFKVLPVGLCKSSQILEAYWCWLQLTFVTCASFSLLWLDEEGPLRIGSLFLSVIVSYLRGCHLT